ncbi:hypothetical protein CASFOL_022412 [Castilleja foliolosa]|uniref:Uncharacterized protein n=1 Tax=Castilleja foliolosa TaxID=1961234 RepID=A0ABD3CUJ2_9LAMI
MGFAQHHQSGRLSSHCTGKSPTQLSHLIFKNLPGFTRSVYKRDHALITPESHVFSPLP